jgi:tetratricopeptide (TPR) repeat protein
VRIQKLPPKHEAARRHKAASRARKQQGERLWTALLGVGALALCLRCLYIWQIHDAPFFDLRIGDAEAYHLWARRIAGGDWLGEGVFYQAPLYPYFLAVIYRILGDGIAAVRLIQAVIGAASCTMLAAAGISLFGRYGAIGGLGLAIYPPAIFLDGLVEKSSLVTFFTAALLALLAVPATHFTSRRCLGVGLILGLLALTRENALILGVPVFLWIVAGPFPGPWRARLARGLVFVAGCALMLFPVGVRNLALGGEFHLTTSQLGANFYIGNHAGADGTYQALVVGHGSAADEREDATRLAERAIGRTLSPGEVSRFWINRSLEYIRSQPLDWLKLTGRKLALTFNATEVSDTETQEVYAEWSWLLRILRPLDFGLLLGMAGLGTVLTAGYWRRIWFLYAVAAAYAFSVVLFYVFSRYRFPIVPVLMVLAAGGLVQTAGLLRMRRLRELAMAAAVAVLALIFAQLPLENRRASRATHYLSIATGLAKDPERLDLALEFCKRSLGEAPEFPAAQFGLGVLLARMGRPEEAIPYYRSALTTWPDYAEARYNLGRALAAAGRDQEASQEYREALRIRPDDADAHSALAKTLIALNRPDLAVEHYQQVLVSRPGDVKALVGLGVALAQLSRTEEAIRNYRLALELDPRDVAAHNNLGWILASQGRIAEAVPHFERALALNPEDENARRNLDQARQILSRSPRRAAPGPQ